MVDASQKKSSSRRNFIKLGAGLVAGAAVAAGAAKAGYFDGATDASKLEALASQLDAANTRHADLTSQLSVVTTNAQSLQTRLDAATSSISTLQSQISTSSAQTTTLQTQATQSTALVALTPDQATLVEAIAETIIPSDSNGPGAKEAGVIYFIDRQLGGEYGLNARFYMQAPFVAPNLPGPITVDGITYTGGSMVSAVNGPVYYQHPITLKEFWQNGLASLQAYSNSAYGGNFETLSTANQTQVLKDLFAGTPTNFTTSPPVEFATEVVKLVWGGFVSDPLYGGNQGLVGWIYVASNGVNQGNFYGEGYTTKQLMVSPKAIRLQPASLGQLQQQSGET